MTTIAFLGPTGTFTEQAALQVAPADAELIPVPSVERALQAVRDGKADRAVVAIENSIEGGVNATIDALAHGKPLVIVREMLVEISFCLAVLPGTTDIEFIGTHPHAWAQCREWVAEHYPNAVHVPTASNAAAAKELAEGDAPFQAVLCPEVSVRQYGLEAIATGVADKAGAVTRFIMVSLPGDLPAPTGADKTTIQVQIDSDRVGGLLSMLEQFSVRGVNLSRIESRPVGDRLGSYAFSIDIAGHVREERVQAALVGLHRNHSGLQFFGSYPRVDGQPNTVLPGTSDAAFRDGRQWVADILDGTAP